MENRDLLALLAAIIYSGRGGVIADALRDAGSILDGATKHVNEAAPAA